MQAKKALAVLLALSMTTAPQAVVSASAENATVQENSDVAPEKKTAKMQVKNLAQMQMKNQMKQRQKKQSRTLIQIL